MNHEYSFEQLAAWKDAKLLAVKTYKFTKIFPKEEKYGIVSQMRRAIISVCSNIAEGSARTTKKDQARFYTIAYGSLIEFLSQCIIAQELSFMDEENYLEVRNEIEKVSFKIHKLKNSILA